MIADSAEDSFYGIMNTHAWYIALGFEALTKRGLEVKHCLRAPFANISLRDIANLILSPKASITFSAYPYFFSTASLI
ncbi:hypothetical protein NPIL_539331 [Nephila pilipes]|uniref:Uncharacterized protein n=1 Tax=Nephila pilipes TaxID=299642 RepID=A0A8X6MC65_NEPPI|nr:hypothetical protein NPIL_539331 [Nephila pilipes]